MKPNRNKAVGIDVGIKYFLTDSESRQIENPRFYERIWKRIKIEQRRSSKKKKKKCSENHGRQRKKLARYYEKLVDHRDDYLHKLSKFYVDSYGIICVENLSIGNMVRNGILAQKILDVSRDNSRMYQL